MAARRCTRPYGATYGDRFRVFQIGFSLFERAWTLRGMETLMMDFIEHPQFVDELLDRIAEFNIAHQRDHAHHPSCRGSPPFGVVNRNAGLCGRGPGGLASVVSQK